MCPVHNNFREGLIIDVISGTSTSLLAIRGPPTQSFFINIFFQFFFNTGSTQTFSAFALNMRLSPIGELLPMIQTLVISMVYSTGRAIRADVNTLWTNNHSVAIVPVSFSLSLPTRKLLSMPFCLPLPPFLGNVRARRAYGIEVTHPVRIVQHDPPWSEDDRVANCNYLTYCPEGRFSLSRMHTFYLSKHTGVLVLKRHSTIEPTNQPTRFSYMSILSDKCASISPKKVLNNRVNETVFLV